MRKINEKGNCWPTRQQELLLRASLLDSKQAIDAWYEWKSEVDISLIDQGSFRLLPLLYHNLHIHGVDDSVLSKPKSVYRFTWYKNQILLRNLSTLLRSFHNAGIQTIILKGAALTLLYYRNYGLRPMCDFDVLVHAQQARKAFSLLTNMGWEPIETQMNMLAPEFFYLKHGHEFTRANQHKADLHWYLLWECCYDGADDDFWNGAVSIELHNQSTHALNPTDQLLHVCVHGVRWCTVPPFRWVADAITILRVAEERIDWDRIVEMAEQRRLVSSLKNALSYLRDRFKAPIPPTVLNRIESIPISRSDSCEYRFKTKSTTLLPQLPVHYVRYSRIAKGVGIFGKIVRFPRYLQHLFGARSLWGLVSYIVIRGVRKIWRTVVGCKSP